MGMWRRAGIQKCHKSLFGRRPPEIHHPETGEEFIHLIKSGRHKLSRRESVRSSEIKYTYVLLADGKLRIAPIFSRFPGAKLSKHAVTSGASESVVYAGEMWFDLDDYGNERMVFDNNSGTYGPRSDHGELEGLTLLLKHNFRDLNVLVKDYRQSKSDRAAAAALSQEESVHRAWESAVYMIRSAQSAQSMSARPAGIGGSDSRTGGMSWSQRTHLVWR